jgi:hypothetical protein
VVEEERKGQISTKCLNDVGRASNIMCCAHFISVKFIVVIFLKQSDSYIF